MESKKIWREIGEILLAIVFLAIAFNFKEGNVFFPCLLMLSIIILVNVIIKKIVAYTYEMEIRNKIWSIKQLGVKKRFQKPLPMIAFPLLVSFLTLGYFQWMPILSFNVETTPEKVSRRHGAYRFSEVTEHHVALVVFWAIFANVILSILSYLLGFETLAKYSIYYALWSCIPLSDLDGSKLFFGNKILWIVTSVVCVLMFFVSFSF